MNETYRDCKFSELLGKTFITIEGLYKGSNQVTFTCSDGSVYRMNNDGSSSYVVIADVCGDNKDLMNSPILRAEERISNSNGMGVYSDENIEGSHTWSFYALATINGYVDIRWLGTSNGYYSERVNIICIHEPSTLSDFKMVCEECGRKFSVSKEYLQWDALGNMYLECPHCTHGNYEIHIPVEKYFQLKKADS